MVCKCWWQTKDFFFLLFFFLFYMQAMVHWVCWETTSESVVLMMQAVEENRRLSVFQWSSVSRRLRQAACLSRVLTCDSRPPVSDSSGRWGLCLYRFVCTPSKLAVVLFPPELGSFFHLTSTDSDHYTGKIYIVIGVWLETHIKPMFFLWVFFFFFFHMSVSGCLVSRYGKVTLLALWRVGGEAVSLHRLDFLRYRYRLES